MYEQPRSEFGCELTSELPLIVTRNNPSPCGRDLDLDRVKVRETRHLPHSPWARRPAMRNRKSAPASADLRRPAWPSPTSSPQYRLGTPAKVPPRGCRARRPGARPTPPAPPSWRGGRPSSPRSPRRAAPHAQHAFSEPRAARRRRPEHGPGRSIAGKHTWPGVSGCTSEIGADVMRCLRT